MTQPTAKFRLLREQDKVLACFESDDRSVPVKIVWARPISARGAEVALIGPDKQEVAMLNDLSGLDPQSRVIAEEELARRYLMPRITCVISATASFGVRYWHVETDLGQRRFALKDASKNAVWLTSDHLVLQDTLGCRYEVNPFSALDVRSRTEIERIL